MMNLHFTYNGIPEHINSCNKFIYLNDYANNL